MKGLEETWQEAKMDFKGQTALVVGASRGFGRGVTESLVAKGMTVTAVARTREDLEDLARKTLARIIVADATDEQAIERILSEAKPNLLVLSAGTTLDLRPLHQHTWETFSRTWEVDTKLTFLGSQRCPDPEKSEFRVNLPRSGEGLPGVLVQWPKIQCRTCAQDE